MNWTYVLLVIYLAIIAMLGYIAYRKTNSDKDYLLAGGEVHPYLMAMAYGSTFISTAAIVGFGGAAAVYGLGILWLTVLNIFVGIFIAFVFFGKRTRAMSKNIGATTFPELLSRRFQSPLMQKLVATLVFVTMPLYAAAVMIGAARFIEQTLNINYNVGLIVFALVVAVYVMTGGLKGVFYTDAFQGTIMFIGMAILIVITYKNLGGITPAHEALTSLASQVPNSLVEQGHMGWTKMPQYGSELWWVLVSTIVMGVGIGVLAQPQLAVRYMTVKTNKEINRAVAIGGVFILFMTGVAMTVGALTNVYFYENLGKISMLAAVDPGTGAPNMDRVIPLYINEALPQWFSVMFMLVLISAAMSTLSGQFHVMGTSISRDIYMGGKTGDQSKSIFIHRLGIIVALVVTVFLSYRLPGNIIAVATAMFFGLCAITFLPTYVAALYWPRATKEGALASMCVGVMATIMMYLFTHAAEAQALGVSQALFGRPVLVEFPWTVIDPLLVGLPLSAITLILVSLATEPMSSYHVDECFDSIISNKQAVSAPIQQVSK
ncbi:SSS family solute:Na+ symporter [Desulfitispora alkaliphila]|uniref:sodium:solute symporter family protein n=1 Tax=Desulfitispora alkaliphila TaxID=622674 RepID=UPI003D23DC48